MISPILPSHDADTVALDLGVFIARRSRQYRCSRDAIVAVIHAAFPLAPASHAPAADTPAVPPTSETDGEAGLASHADPSVEPIHEPAAPASDPAKPTDPQAKHAVEGALSSEPGGVQDRCESTPPTPSHQGETLGEKVTAPCDTADTGKSAGGDEPPAAPAPNAPTKSQLVRDCNDQHPDWPASKIAEATGVPQKSIYALLGKGRVVPSEVAYRQAQQAKVTEALRSAPAKPQESVERAGPPTPRSQPQQPPAAKSEPRGPSLPSAKTLKERVREAHAAHSDWTAAQIANYLGHSQTSVSTVLGIVRGEAKPAEPPPQFADTAALRLHYGDVAKRLGKPS